MRKLTPIITVRVII